MNFTEMLRRAVSLGIPAIENGDEETLTQLHSEIASLAEEIEGMFQEWDHPPEGIEQMVEDMDEAYYKAGESYLEVCDLIANGLAEKEKEPLEEALKELEQAAEAMQAAEELVQAKLLSDSSK